jgi:hypothetical protein
MIQRENVIRNYIDGYNQFDINKMLIDFHDDIQFENIENGICNLKLYGLSAFKAQAEKAATIFVTRKQTPLIFHHRDDETETHIDYHAVLAIDLPNGMKKGEELRMQGRSIFKFSDNKIVELTDIS